MLMSLPDHCPESIFRAYDIRGLVAPGGLCADIAYAIGLAIGAEVRSAGGKEIVVGRDARLSGPAMKVALVQGLVQSGCRVTDIGTVPTPLLYFAIQHLNIASGVMVTASHNPRDHNGFKIVIEGKTLETSAIKRLYQRVVSKDFTGEAPTNRLTVQYGNVTHDYIAAVLQNLTLDRPLKLVIDCGNGIAGDIAPMLYQSMGCEVIPLYCEVDGNFPNHHPDPAVPENLKDLMVAVKQHKADIGLAFDGDADRLGVVTNTGDIIWPDRQLMLFAKDVLDHHPGARVVFDVKCSRDLSRFIEELGGMAVLSKTGHSILKATMESCDGMLAGEMSGHILFRDGWYGFDDGLYAGARLLSILAQTSLTAHAVFDALPNSISTPEIKVVVAENAKAPLMGRLSQYSPLYQDAVSVIDIDGIRVEYADGWGLVRPSNTSPCLTLRFEADSQQALKRIQAEFRAALVYVDSQILLDF